MISEAQGEPVVLRFSPRWLVFPALYLAVALGGEAVPYGMDGLWLLRIFAFAFGTATLTFDLWRPRAPAWLVTALVAAPAAWLNVVDIGSLSMVLLVATVGWMAYSRPLRDAMPALLVGIAATASFLPDRDVSGLVGVVVVLCIFVAAARLLLRQQQLLNELRAAQQELETQAAAAERRRIAADLHDVVAHSLAVSLLQLTGARMLAKRSRADPLIVDALTEAESVGRQSMANLRRVVGLLRESGHEDAAAVTGPAAMAELVEQYRAAGLPLTAQGLEAAAGLSPTLALAIYRITQEGLANVVKHAGRARTRLTLAVKAEYVELRIENDLSPQATASPASAGFGIRGMRERASVFGGHLEAARVGTRWVLRAELPTTDAAAREGVRL